MLTEEDMVMNSTQVFDGEETAAAVPPVTLAAPVVAVPVPVPVPVPLSQSSRSSRTKSSERASMQAKSKEDRQATT